MDAFVILSDGRKLFYIDYSDNEQCGHLVLYFHGTPGYRHFLSNKQVEILHTNELFAKNIRLVSVERPGFGDSDDKSGRSLMDYAEDILELLPHLCRSSDEMISIIGYSAGGPFALACAAHPILSKRIKSITVVSSLGPREQPDSTENMPIKYRFGFWLSKYWVRATAWILGLEASNLMRNPERETIESWKDSSEDYKYIQKNEEVMQTFMQNAIYVYERGQYWTEAWEYHLFASYWGFRVEDISSSVRVHVFYGLKDTHCVPAMGKYLGKAIPSAREYESAELGHMVFF